jgi:VanZ family protein
MPSPSSRWATVAVVGLTIAIGSLSPAPAGTVAGLEDGPLVGADKYLHFVGFVGLGAAAVLAAGRRRPTSRVLVATVLTAGAFGAGIELLQHAVPGRTPEVADALANALGAAAGATLGAVVRSRTGGP